MRPGALKSVLLGMGFAHLLFGSAAADEAWTCRYTEERYRLRGHETVLPGTGTFILRLTPKVVSIVVTSTSGETFAAVSYPLVENSDARLVAAGRFERKGGRFDTVTFRLEKKSGRFIQAGDRQTHIGRCSRTSIGALPLVSAKPPAGGADPGSGSRLESPLPRRPLARKRGA